MKNKISIKNRKAKFEFIIIEEFVAGIALVGSEVKSIKAGNASFTDAYCFIKDDEVFLKSLHISEHKTSIHQNHEPKRDRKLLLTKREIKKLKKKTQEKGLTIIPTKIFVSETGLIKVVIALAQGKKIHDKRVALRDKENKKHIKENI